jgi:hypothetical protein
MSLVRTYDELKAYLLRAPGDLGFDYIDFREFFEEIVDYRRKYLYRFVLSMDKSWWLGAAPVFIKGWSENIKILSAAGTIPS